MAIRVFTDGDGQEWNVWLVKPSMGEDSPLSARFRDGWLCFQQANGTGRCRLPLDEAPPSWDALPNDRLDLLRRVAEQAAGTRGTGLTEEARRAAVEESGRSSVSGPREVAGRDDTA